jgi:hypothetical protein
VTIWYTNPVIAAISFPQDSGAVLKNAVSIPFHSDGKSDTCYGCIPIDRIVLGLYVIHIRFIRPLIYLEPEGSWSFMGKKAQSGSRFPSPDPEKPVRLSDLKMRKHVNVYRPVCQNTAFKGIKRMSPRPFKLHLILILTER